jgi:hypothetical protein
MSLHEPTIPDLLQAIAVLNEWQDETIVTLRNAKNELIRQRDTITRLETELATLRARGS